MGYNSGLLERERELEALSAALKDAEAGRGSFVILEGAAGIGETRMLATVADAATSTPSMIVSVRCSELEQGFTFGLVRQLFESLLTAPARREDLLQGAAAAARPVFEPTPQDSAAGDFALLHGLYWLTASLCQERSLVVLIDDLQWIDVSSLRFLAYLQNRIDGLAIVVASIRTGEAESETSRMRWRSRAGSWVRRPAC